MPSEIEKNIVKVSKAKRKVGETKDAFMAKVVGAFSATGVVSDEEWEGLGKPAQDWVNAATKALAAKQPFPAMPDADGAAPPAAPAVGPKGAKAAAKVAAPKAAPKAALPKAAAKVAKPKKAKGESSRGGMTKAIHNTMIRNPNTTEAELDAKLKAAGFDPSPTYIRSARAFCRQFITVMQDLGKWSGTKLA